VRPLHSALTAPVLELLRQAIVCHQAGCTHDALVLYWRVLAVESNNAQALSFVGTAHVQLGHIEQLPAYRVRTGNYREA
jgi:hypothetical protein